MSADIGPAVNVSAEADYRTALTPAERTLVAEFDELNALYLAGQLPIDKETRWFILSRAIDGIWYRTAMAKMPVAQDETGPRCP